MCNVCRIKFPNEIVSSTLENHLHTHFIPKRLACRQMKNALKKHETEACFSRRRTKVRRFECDICKRHFQLKGHSKNILSHNRIKPCKYCNKRYKRPWSLKMHKYWHTRLKRFKRDFCKIREGTVCKSHSHTSHTLMRNLTSIMPAKVSTGRNVR
ncbi:E4F1 factor, partial [Acromyrmex charruanus]